MQENYIVGIYARLSRDDERAGSAVSIENQKEMVAELIDHIEVYHAEKQDGITNQRIVIHYNCIGAFDVPDRRKIPEATLSWKKEKA